jgi:signal transduction histidine kinase
LKAPVAQIGGAESIHGDGELAEYIRAFDWSHTSLGAISSWPETLVFLVNAALATRQPMLLMWGPHMIQIYNDAFAPILTNRHPAALGQPGRELWRDVWPVVGEQLEAVLHHGRNFFQERALVPILRNGLLQDAWFNYSYSPAFNSDHSVAGIVVICEDVTSQVTAEQERARVEEALRLRQDELALSLQALRAQRARLLGIVHQAPVLFAVLEGPQHRFTMANAIYLQVVSHRDVLGRTVAEALPEAVEQGYLEILDRVFSTGEPFLAQGAHFYISPVEGKPPDERILDFVYQPLREEDGAITGIIVIGVDITYRKRAEKALIQSEKLAAVGRLASTIAHEINNPLESVTNLVYLASHTDSLAVSRDFLELADQELRRMSAIATQTLHFNKQSTEPRPITCTELIRSVINIYESRLRNSSISVDFRLRVDTPVVCYDGEIRQVLNNLVSNAIDALPPSDGRLLLRSREATDWKTGRPGILITVADTGAGISTQHRERIFEPFFTTKGLSGTGLGLWVSRDIVERHEGKLRVRSSRGPTRHGTVFTIFLPRRPHPAG